MGDGLDVDAALGGGDDHRLGGGAVEQDGQVVFLFDVAGLGEVERLHLAAGRAGLDGDQRVVEHLVGVIERVGLGLGEFDAALVAVGEGTLATPTGVYLRFDDDRSVGELRERRLKFSGGFGGNALGYGHSELLKERLGLIFVDIHGSISSATAQQANALKKPRPG